MNAKRVTFSGFLILGTVLQLDAQSPGTVLWTYDVGSIVVSSPAVGLDGTVYVGSSSAVYAITNAGSTASNKWTFPAGMPPDSASPAISGDGTICFVGGLSNSLYAVRPDGSQKWVFPGARGGGTPAIDFDGAIYYHALDHLLCVNQDGTQRWAFPVAGQSSSPVIGPSGLIYISSELDSKLYAVSHQGTQLWEHAFSGSSYGVTPLSLGSDASIYATHAQLWALRPDGTNLWSASADGYPLQGEATLAGDGTAYASTAGNHRLYAFTPAGQVGWHALESGDRSVSTAPAIDAGGSIYYCVSNSVLAVSRSGQVQWSIFGGFDPLGQPLARTSPVIAPDGTLYATLGTKLYAIATGTNGPANSPWPMYQQNARHTGKVEKPVLKQPQKRADANFQFQLYAQIDQTQTVQTSTDLVTWAPLTSVVVTNVPMDVVDLGASNFPSRFYRAVTQ